MRSQIFAKVSQFFSKLLNVRPRHKRDYYGIFGWLVSRRLVYLIIVAMGLFSAVYLYNTCGVYFRGSGGTGIKTYNYNSLALRFTSGNVRIRGKSKYLAYEGQVSKGYCNGEGTLYQKNGNKAYEGNFTNSKYEGEGTSYYENGNISYAGSFHDNKYDGEGTQYRESGSLLYTGTFSSGMKEGTGTLYSNAGDELYTGTFSKDHIVYSELLGKTTEEVAKSYFGDRAIWSSDKDYAVYMSDIAAVYAGQKEKDALDESITADIVYVLSDTFTQGNSVCDSISDLNKLFGKPVYEGNANVTLGEAVAINAMCQTTGDVLNGPVTLETENLYSDYTTVNSIEDYMIYLYSYEADGLMYNFITSKRNGNFFFYSIVKGESGE